MNTNLLRLKPGSVLAQIERKTYNYLPATGHINLNSFADITFLPSDFEESLRQSGIAERQLLNDLFSITTAKLFQKGKTAKGQLNSFNRFQRKVCGLLNNSFSMEEAVQKVGEFSTRVKKGMGIK